MRWTGRDGADGCQLAVCWRAGASGGRTVRTIVLPLAVTVTGTADSAIDVEIDVNELAAADVLAGTDVGVVPAAALLDDGVSGACWLDDTTGSGLRDEVSGPGVLSRAAGGAREGQEARRRTASPRMGDSHRVRGGGRGRADGRVLRRRRVDRRRGHRRRDRVDDLAPRPAGLPAARGGSRVSEGRTVRTRRAGPTDLVAGRGARDPVRADVAAARLLGHVLAEAVFRDGWHAADLAAGAELLTGGRGGRPASAAASHMTAPGAKETNEALRDDLDGLSVDVGRRQRERLDAGDRGREQGRVSDVRTGTGHGGRRAGGWLLGRRAERRGCAGEDRLERFASARWVGGEGSGRPVEGG